MKKVIIIKYGELSTKSDNINFFLKTLKDNIDKKLNNIEHEIKYDYGRMLIYTNDFEKCVSKIKEVFGIHEIVIGYLFKEKDIEIINEKVLELVSKNDFFFTSLAFFHSSSSFL